MRILSHYFIARFLGLFVMVLAAAFMVLATIELVLNLDDLTGGAVDAGSSLVETLRALGLRLTSYYLADVIPVASFVAAFVAFALSGRAMEVLAVEAGGVRPFRIVAPVLGTALILSLATALLHETVILRADQLWSGTAGSPREEIDFGRQAFWMRAGPMITRVGGANPETRTLHDVEIFERSATTGSVVRIIRTDRVDVDLDGHWRIDEASTWQFDPRDPEADPVYTTSTRVELDPAAMNANVLRGADPTHLPIRSLARYLAGEPTDPPSTLRRMRARLHERLASPWLVLVFAWLAVPLGLRVDHRGRIAGPAVASIVVLALFFVTQSAGQTLAQQQLFPIGLTPWLNMAVFSVAAGIALRFRRD